MFSFILHHPQKYRQRGVPPQPPPHMHRMSGATGRVCLKAEITAEETPCTTQTETKMAEAATAVARMWAWLETVSMQTCTDLEWTPMTKPSTLMKGETMDRQTADLNIQVGKTQEKLRNPLISV